MTSNESPCTIATRIKAEAARLGFDACGFATAARVSEPAAAAYDRWIEQGMNDCMAWAANHRHLRLDPTQLFPGAKTVISLAVNYLPPVLQPAQAPQVARYAYGDDYHEVVRDMARQLAAFIERLTGEASRVCVDSAPILERYWAQQAGLGFRGRNSLLIIPGKGSFFFLCEVVTTLALPPDAPCTLTCGDCRACERGCPGGALSNGTLDARRCLSCQTIENRAEQLPPWVAQAIGHRLFGCDQCQLACPHNRHAAATANPHFHARPAILSYSREQWATLTPEQFALTFRHSPLKRAKLAALLRNLSLTR